MAQVHTLWSSLSAPLKSWTLNPNPKPLDRVMSVQPNQWMPLMLIYPFSTDILYSQYTYKISISCWVLRTGMGEGLIFTLDTMMFPFLFFSLESQLDLEPWEIEDHLSDAGIHHCHLLCKLYLASQWQHPQPQSLLTYKVVIIGTFLQYHFRNGQCKWESMIVL